MKVATYTRISTDEERQPLSLEAQADRLGAYIATQDNWKITRTYSDQTSGKTLERTGLRRALADARTGTYELLLVLKVDRLARSTAGLARILEELDAAGVAFRSASEPFDTSTAAGRMMVQMLGVFAEFEREMIVERTKMGLAKKASKGEWTGGRPAFGYGYDAEQRLLLPTPEEALVVTEIFRRYTDGGTGSAAISRWLNETGRTRRGYRWTPKTVIDVLRNATYTGRLPFNGQLYPAGHEPLVDNDRFERAQALLAERSVDHGRRRSNPSPYLLTSFLRCLRCGHGFVGTVAHGRGGAYRYYTCFSRHRHGTKACDQERIPADPLEEAIISETLASLDDGALFLEAARQAQEAWLAANGPRDAELRHVEEAISNCRRTIRRYLEAFEKGDLAASSCGERVRDLEAEIEALELRRADLQAERDTPPVGLGDLDALRTRIETAVTTAAPEQIKQLLSTVITQITVESRASIQPFFIAPGVRIVSPQRRRTGIEPARRLSPPHRF